MRLSPELGAYARAEGIDHAHFSHQIKTFDKARRAERKERKKHPFRRALDTVDTVSRKSVAGFFDGLTTLRTHAPNAVKLFPWEKWYFEEYPDAGDPKKKKTWKDLKEDKIDARKMYVMYLQDRYVVSEKMLLNLADQATTQDNRNSWLFFNQKTQQVLSDWVDHEWPTVISQGVAKGLISVVPQHPDVDALYFLGGGAAASKVGTDQFARRGSITNNINRMGSEFSLLLKTHYLSHQRSLAEFKEFSSGEINELSGRLFLGSRFDIESAMVKREAKGVAVGVALAQLLQDSTAGSLQNALINLIGPAAAAAYLYRKIRKERSGEAVDHYIHTQTELNDAIDVVSKSVSSQRGRGISLDLEATGIPQRREELVRELAENQKRVFGPLNQTPLWLAAGTTVYDAFHVSQLAPGAQSLVTGGIIVAALTPYTEEFTRRRNAEVKNREIERVKRMISAIDTAEHRIPRYIDIAEGGTLTRKEAIPVMEGPMVIQQLDSGSKKRTVSVEEPIVLDPGISLVRAPVGGGKSLLLRLLALEQGNLQTMRIQKGVDFRRIDPGALSDLVYHVEAVPPATNLTIAEQMLPYITDKDSFLYESIMNQQFVEPPRLLDKYGREKLDQFYDTFTKRPDLLLGWVENPLGDPENPDSEIASTLLTRAFFYQVNHKFAGIRTQEDAAEYLLRKSGASQGTSTGEAQKLELLKAFMKKDRKVILLDEPTANFEGNGNGNATATSSVTMVVDMMRDYLRASPDTVILIASNDERLDFPLKLYTAPYLRQEITRKYGRDYANYDNRIVWEAGPIENDVFPSLMSE